MNIFAPFHCTICEQESIHICVKCTKDTCNNHLCEKCGSCSDCCDCELHLDSQDRASGEPAYEGAAGWDRAPDAVRDAAHRHNGYDAAQLD